MIIFLANENFPYPSIKLLRLAGFEVKSIGEDFFGISDKKVIEIAQLENRVILTFDRDYGELIIKHALQNPPAIIYFRLKGETPSTAGEILLKLLNDKNLELLNHFTVIDSNNIRQRKY